MEKAKRNIHYSLKISPEEDAAIRQKMEAFGIRNRSTYLRAMMLNGYLLKLDLLEMHEAVRLMGKMSGNINQIARRLNEHGSIYETEMDEIVDEQRELKELLSQILQRLGHDHGLRSEKNP
ncbi:MAG: plasmid mobilization relaxosome protein MobC [bacterium]|nr:plasmid mobilization relaxosome protein MobC [bacterium]